MEASATTLDFGGIPRHDVGVYTLRDYGKMISSTQRMNAYARAIERVVRPGDLVLDLGAGTGICTLLALKAGARHVFAVDTNPLVLRVPDLCRANGFDGRVTALCEDARELSVEDHVDVIVSDLRGVVPLFGNNAEIVADVAKAWLKKGGELIPDRDRLFVCPVESADLYRDVVGPFSAEPFGFDMKPLHEELVCQIHHDRGAPLRAEHRIAAPRAWTEIKYGVAPSESIRAEVLFQFERDAIFHGLGLWFEGTLTEGVVISSAPGEDVVYGRGFLPLREPLEAKKGETLKVTLWARRTRDHYLWAWNIEHRGATMKHAMVPVSPMSRSSGAPNS